MLENIKGGKGMSKQNELWEILEQLSLGGGYAYQINEAEQKILALFREKARQTAHECVPTSEVFGFWDNCIKQTHKNIDDKFDAWGK